MAAAAKGEKRVSSPTSTGGAGTFFEQHVDAFWLTLLLVRGIPPVLHDGVVTGVDLQAEHLGWGTDDFLVEAESGAGTRRKLVGQVKRTFTVSAADEECRKAIGDFWRDFGNTSLFSPTTDRFVLVTLRGTNTLLEHFTGLLDCARSSRSGTDFEHRLGTPGFLSTKAVQYCQEVCTIIEGAEGTPKTAADVWDFLRLIHVLSLDLNTSTRQTEALVKSLLAYTSRDHDPVRAADTTWTALLREVGEGMGQARRYTREDLPQTLRDRHTPVGSREQHALQALKEHSDLILAGIRSTIGEGVQLARGQVIHQTLEQLCEARVVLLSGAAGSGKSGAAKEAIAKLATDHFVFCFRAEEFAHAHFDETLQRSQIPATSSALAAMLGAQGRKVLLIESLERLLEASTRDSFTDLLTLVANDGTWQLLMTCREYSVDLVRASFLEATRLAHVVVDVPPLNDEELEEVKAGHPNLARPLASDSLRQLLRNPYLLDKARQINWDDDRPLPDSERDFRKMYWQQVVRADHHAAGGMPRKREAAFVQVAVRRARALTLYASVGDLDAEAVDRLVRDSLVLRSPTKSTQVAPAHDVLEDWAILEWIEEQHAEHESTPTALPKALGTYPAIRRTYRKWIGELVERDPVAADQLFEGVVNDTSAYPAQFRDDSIIALLRSSQAVKFLKRHTEKLFANDKELLRRVIHLLRVACVTASPLLPSMAPVSMFNVPDGEAWGSLLRIIADRIRAFGASDCGHLLGLIDEWARGVSWQRPYPDGFEAVATIAHWLLDNFDDYEHEKPRKKVLQVIAKVPNGNRRLFTRLLLGEEIGEKPHNPSRMFRKQILEEMEGAAASRDLPDEVIAAATDHIQLSEENLRDRWGGISHTELEPFFGIKTGSGFAFFPASAYRGPFLPLLRHHPKKGIEFIRRLINHSVDWYAHPRVHGDRLEPPSEITLAFADGTTRKQWGNERLWNLYRGTSVGPSVLQSALMALELWLLELANACPKAIDAVLLRIMRESDSVSLTAVAASVATSHPRQSGLTLLALLSSRDCIFLDRQRMVCESGSPSSMARMMPRLDARNDLYNEERKQADELPHRKQDLEIAIANLQFGSLAARVHEILDHHRSKLPPLEQQTKADQLWRLSLHRMDIRSYSADEVGHESIDGPDIKESQLDEQKQIQFNLNLHEPDIQELVSQAEAEWKPTNALLGLLMWGVKVFERDAQSNYRPEEWRTRLQAAMAVYRDLASREQWDFTNGGPGFVAAVCIRDHWEELSSEEREWCAATACTEVERAADTWNFHERIQRGGMSADRPCAWVVSGLVGKELTPSMRDRVTRALVSALTHAVDEVRTYAAAGIGNYLWAADREFALRCVNGLAAEATQVQRALQDTSSHRYENRPSLDQIEGDTAEAIRRQLLEADGIPATSVGEFDLSDLIGSKAGMRIAALFGQAANEPIAAEFFKQVATTLVGWWDADSRRDREPRRNYDVESSLTELFENFLLRASNEVAGNVVAPVLGAVDAHPKEVARVVEGLVAVEDRHRFTPKFWAIWDRFAARLKVASWLPRLDDKYSSGKEMISAVFLGLRWKEEVRHWNSLTGSAERIDQLFDSLPLSDTVFNCYTRFLHDVGEQSLPTAFVRLNAKLDQGESQRMLQNPDTAYMLEVLLQRNVYGRPLELKRQAALRNAILQLLDRLVEAGSSAAFRMRDDFVTPLTVSEA